MPKQFLDTRMTKSAEKNAVAFKASEKDPLKTLLSTVRAMRKGDSDAVKPSQENFDGNLTGLKVLLVEDSIDNQDIITFFLAKAGALVEIAGNGLEGVEKALKGTYNVVLMDIQMPKMDGYQATIKLRKEGYKIPIIALTAQNLKEERQKCLDVGYSEHMTKPVNRKLLIQRVAEFAGIDTK